MSKAYLILCCHIEASHHYPVRREGHDADYGHPDAEALNLIHEVKVARTLCIAPRRIPIKVDAVWTALGVQLAEGRRAVRVLVDVIGDHGAHYVADEDDHHGPKGGCDHGTGDGHKDQEQIKLGSKAELKIKREGEKVGNFYHVLTSFNIIDEATIIRVYSKLPI